MSKQDLPTPPGKYNDWCHRRGLVCADKDRLQRAMAWLNRHDLTPFEQAAFHLHELVGCEGMEFVAFSNATIKDPVTFANGVVLVPCFLSGITGCTISDPLVQRTLKMQSAGRFIYDGWIPIQRWGEGDVRQAVRRVDETLAVFCLKGRTYFQWEPKYRAPTSDPAYEHEDQHLTELKAFISVLDSLDDHDRSAIYKSLAWLSQGLCLDDPTSRFLFSVLAIESLARYIEREASEKSSLVVLSAERSAEEDRLARCCTCIDDTLKEWLHKDPTKAVTTAYLDCVHGIKRQLQDHLQNLEDNFTSDPEPVALLFKDKVGRKSLWELRNDVAHGTVDTISEVQRERIRQRVWDAERIARRYILAVLKSALGTEPFSAKMKASLFIPMQDAVGSHEGMYKGPTHMADVYY